MRRLLKKRSGRSTRWKGKKEALRVVLGRIYSNRFHVVWRKNRSWCFDLNVGHGGVGLSAHSEKEVGSAEAGVQGAVYNGQLTLFPVLVRDLFNSNAGGGGGKEKTLYENVRVGKKNPPIRPN